jgi:hypothetical protein
MTRSGIFVVVLALLAPSLFAGPEVAVGKPVYGPAAGDHWQPQVASDGHGFLVTWRDGRSGDGERLLAARVASDGNVLDRVGRTVVRGTASNARPVWTGSNYLVVWSTGREVLGATVDRDGHVSAPFVIAANAHLSGTTHTAGDGSVTLVAYRRGTELRAALLDAEGRIAGDVQLAAEGRQYGDVSVATNGRQFLVAWGDETGDAHVLRVARDGSPIGSPRNLGPGSGALVASDGTDFVIAVRRHHGGQLTWSSRRIAADFSEVAATLPLPNAMTMTQPSLLWNGSEYLFVALTFTGDAQKPFDIAAVRIARNGRPLADNIAVESINMDLPGGTDPAPGAATNGRSILGAWVESFFRDNQRETRVVARMYSASTLTGTGNEVLLSLGANQQLDPSLTFGGTTAIMIWREPRGVYATRVTSDGIGLDERGILLSTGAGTAAPEITFDGTQYVAAWLEDNAVEIRFIDTAGGVLSDALRIPGAYSYAMANAGRATVIAWIDSEKRLWATRIDRLTRLTETPVAVSPAGMEAFDPAISWNRRETLIVWNEVASGYYYGPMMERLRIRGARLSNVFALIDTAPLLIGDARGIEDFAPSAGSNGLDWLVTWSNEAGELRANRVFRNATLSSTSEGSLLADAGSSEVTFDGTRYAVAFKHERNLAVGFLPETGAIAFSAHTNLGDTRSRSQEYTIVGDGTGVALAYTRTSDAPEHTGVERAFLRPVEPVRKTRSVRR